MSSSPAAATGSRGKPEEDGDLGLQGLSLAPGSPSPHASPPSPKSGTSSPAASQGTSSGLMRLLGSVVGSGSAAARSAAFAAPDDAAQDNTMTHRNSSSHSFHSAADDASHSYSASSAGGSSRRGSASEGKSPAGKGRGASATPALDTMSESYSQTDGSAVPSTPTTVPGPVAQTPTQSAQSATAPSSVTQRSGKKKKKSSKHLSRMRSDIAGPPSERPLAGSSGGPVVGPRRTSITKGTSVGSASLVSSAGDRRASSIMGSDTASTSRNVNGTGGQGAERSSEGSNGTKSLSAGIPAGARARDSVLLEDKLQAANDAVQGITNGSSRRTARTQVDATGTLQREDKLDEAAVQRWVLSVGCVNFDLEKGPDLEYLYPSLGISREERDCMAFSSFPDTSIFDDGHAVFSWRVREVPLDSSASAPPVIASSVAQSPSKTSMADGKQDTRSGRSGAPSPLRRLAVFDRPNLLRSFSSDEKVASPANCTPSQKNSKVDETIVEGVATPSPQAGSPTQMLSPDASLNSHRRGRLSRPASSFSGEGDQLAEDDEATRQSTLSNDVPVADLIAREAPVQRRTSHSSSTNYIHGFCYFRQKRDATIRRGYFQKSLVILSHLPYVSFFGQLVRQLGPLFFEKGMPVLEAFCRDVQAWPPPEPGARLHLPLLGSVISVELPFYSQPQASALSETNQLTAAQGLPSELGLLKAPVRRHDGSKESEPILASIPLTPIFEVFREALDDMWLLWECLVLAEPILVVGPDPTVCSEAIWHMLDLIKPIPFAGDFRPYFTIHDHDFKALVSKNKPGAGTIIGVTNPFMLQACKHWPHILKVGKGAVKTGTHGKSGKRQAGGVVGGGMGGIAGGNSAGGGGPDHTPGLVSKRKRRVSKERALLKRLADIAEGRVTDESANEALRRYFTDLTERFLAPLNRYVSSLIPADFSLSSPSETPKIKPFNTTAFLASLKSHGTPLPIRSRNLPTGSAVRQSLYLDFIQCPNFSTWLHARIHQSQEEQYMRKLAALESGDIARYVSTRGEVETIDLYARLAGEIEGINGKLVADRRERELQPNSRWKSANAMDDTASAVSKAALDGLDPNSVAGSSAGAGATQNGREADVGQGLLAPAFQELPTASTSSPPLASLVALPATGSSAQSIRNVINAAGWTRSFTQGERLLLNKKARLIDQLGRLLSALPDDLRQTLLLKERQRRQEFLQQQQMELQALHALQTQ